jgi:hypothetical protein
LTDPKEWRVLKEFLSDCLVVLVVAVGAGDLAVASFHIPATNGSVVLVVEGTDETPEEEEGRADESVGTRDGTTRGGVTTGAGSDTAGGGAGEDNGGNGTGDSTGDGLGLMVVLVGPVVLGPAD